MEQNYIDIGERKFFLKKISLGQTDELCKEFGIEVKKLTGENFSKVIQSSTDNACKFFAIILCEKGVDLSERDIAATAKYLKYNLDEDKINELYDFFLKYGKETLGGQKKDARSATIHEMKPKK